MVVTGAKTKGTGLLESIWVAEGNASIYTCTRARAHAHTHRRREEKAAVRQRKNDREKADGVLRQSFSP